MHILENRFISQASIPKNYHFYFSNFNCAAIDIETTGLFPETGTIILIGVLAGDGSDFCVTQFFADTPQEEGDLLSAFFDFAEPYDILFNYNGTAFDLPFINKRSKLLNLNRTLPLYKSCDLYRITKTSFLAQCLPNLKLKTVEKMAGVQRKDKISGKDCIILYQKYLHSRDDDLRRQILLHNYEDLSCFTSLARLIKKIDFHKAIHLHGFPVKTSIGTFYIKLIKRSSDRIVITGQVPDIEMDCTYYLDDSILIVDANTTVFHLEVTTKAPPSNQQIDYRLINLEIINVLNSF